MIEIVGLSIGLFIALIFLFFVCVRWKRDPNVVAFFHPYCNAGGGGERVLWCAINAMFAEYGSKNKKLRFVVYTGDDATPNEILAKAQRSFNLDTRRVEFVYLSCRTIVDAKWYPIFTMIFQAFGGLVLGIEALCKFTPGVFIDSMGYSFTLPLFAFAGSKVGCYVHYPTISCDMIGMVDSGKAAHNNARWIARSSFLTFFKALYYRMFAKLYGWSGSASTVVMVNGSWTMGHIKNLWTQTNPIVVFPPCNVEHFLKLSEDDDVLPERLLASEMECQILSVGQIRPEKNHRLQIDALALIKEKLSHMPAEKHIDVNLVVLGGCRHAEDQKRAEDLKAYASSLGLIEEQDIQWALNAPFNDLCNHLKASLIGFHSMWNEHFGIAVVEGMAIGNIMVAHDSGGPKLDIIQQEYGLLASTAEEYASQVLKILAMSPQERNEIRKRARAHAEEFSEANFELRWNAAVRPLMV
ncbi:hypothetical protein L596_024223 [Steinernema carpocapsae]|uniref:GDP-Man:Man(3)GlcNAc(2)-PP-Dol alpha-1,2-mannosyltransferase n=1 Tax=Steinernema carpocapsae TaxID=34508 RepID=A0A4U5MG48_STECR|nr:hypothetical protein L596_024223 [Steinernema carpocapsae]